MKTKLLKELRKTTKIEVVSYPKSERGVLYMTGIAYVVRTKMWNKQGKKVERSVTFEYAEEASNYAWNVKYYYAAILFYRLEKKRKVWKYWL